jgi:hypothetical protein
MKTVAPRARDFDELLAFLPRLYARGFKPVIRWEGGEADADGVFTMPWPKYSPVVGKFVSIASKKCWSDSNYSPEEAAKMLKNEQFVSRATLTQVRAMLTFCVRWERFCDGHWAAMIEEGHVRNLLTRLHQLRPR